ncbi:MAG: hypothetical protein IJL88_03140 [Clostridia bacterium]|nr:hypothetical protein [Clostridia bacterium]
MSEEERSSGKMSERKCSHVPFCSERKNEQKRPEETGKPAPRNLAVFSGDKSDQKQKTI